MNRIDRTRGTRPWLGFALLLCLLAFAGGGCAAPSIGIRLGSDVERPPKSVVIFFVDGMDLTRLEELVAKGALPHIRERFFDGGTQIRNAVTSLPSVTYPNCTSMITGVYPGHHGIVGNYWFDRRTLRSQYYMTYHTYRRVNDHFTRPTLYDLLGDQFTVNIQGHTRRGVTETIDNRAMFGWAWFTHDFTRADLYAGMQFREVGDLANHVKRWPIVTMTYYPATDEIGHRHGANSEKYAISLINIDGVVNRITDAIDAAGLGDSTYYVLAADHAHVPIGPNRQFDLLDWLRDERKLRVRSKPIRKDEYNDRLSVLEAVDVVGGLDEDRSAMLHLRGKRGWAYRPEHAEVEAWVRSEPRLTDVPAVGFALLLAGPDRVRVLARDGAALVERRFTKEGPEYRLVNEEGDPLRYHTDAALGAFTDAGWHSSRAWLEATIDAAFPDFPSQAVDMFDSTHTGDVVVFAADDWSLYGKQQGGHGSCCRRDMRIPLFFAGPDIPRGAAAGPGRIVDVVPTILGLLDQKSRLKGVTLDGIDLTDQIRSAPPRTPAPSLIPLSEPRP